MKSESKIWTYEFVKHTCKHNFKAAGISNPRMELVIGNKNTERIQRAVVTPPKKRLHPNHFVIALILNVPIGLTLYCTFCFQTF